MDAIAFQPGDVVVLKSGSPNLTVTAAHANGVVECAFFDGPAFCTVAAPGACFDRASGATVKQEEGAKIAIQHFESLT